MNKWCNVVILPEGANIKHQWGGTGGTWTGIEEYLLTTGKVMNKRTLLLLSFLKTLNNNGELLQKITGVLYRFAKSSEFPLEIDYFYYINNKKKFGYLYISKVF